jgi:hypothetical protein
MKISVTLLAILLIAAVALGCACGYGVSEGFSSGRRYKCREYVDMSKYMLKTECPAQPDMSQYVRKSDVPKCPPCICSCRKPCNVGKCPPCPRPRCPPQRKSVCAPCPACPEPRPCKCPEPEIIIKEVRRPRGNMDNVRPSMDSLYGIFGGYSTRQ